MIALNCEALSLSFGADDILTNLTLSLAEGDKLGIVGVNGAGKSSLFAMITGAYTPTSGAVHLARGKTIGLLEQTITYESSQTILEEAYATFSDLIHMEAELEDLRTVAEKTGKESDAKRFSDLQERFTERGGYEFRGRCKGILKNLGLPEIFWDKPVSSLSGGQKTRLSLTCLLLRDPDILMLDEPTNHLDTDALTWLESYLKASRKTVLVISHDRYFLDAVVNRILEIEHGKGKLYAGSYTAYVKQKEVDREIEERHYKNQQAEIRRIEAYIEQQRRWNRERNIIAAESRQKMLDKMEKLDRPEALPDTVRMRFNKAEESGNDVLSVHRLAKSYPGKALFEEATFEVRKHDRLFICGPNGCGKSTLIKILAGRLHADRGSVSPGYNVRIGYYDQENQDLHPNNTVLDELWNAYPGLTETTLRSTLALFLFKGDDVTKQVSVLSGGEKARLTLAKLMLSKMNLLILDEPTNHLDIPSREILERALLEFDGTIIAVSHDRYFINKLATRILDFGAEAEHRLFAFQGGYEAYLRYKKEALTAGQAEIARPTVMTAAKEQYLSSKRDLAEQRKQERKIKKTKEEIASCEARIAEINESMKDEALFYDYVRLAELEKELATCEERLLSLYELIDELEGL
ncbi:MAG: ABC-F family ATP-binding cassette domain-containing protein [Ruminococcaceae bacterium]|nr:ABC-F family ATP-binding cassette domain-containing protein [Oscillospiraceae bacterium]